MLTKSFIAGVIVLLFSFSCTIVSGQCTVYYCSGCVNAGLCQTRTFATREEAEQSANMACPGGGSRIDCSGSNNGGGKLITSPIPSGVIGSLLGGLGGSLLVDANGKNQVGTGAAIGYGVFSTLSLLINKKKRSVGENIFIGALTGGSLGYAAAQIEQSTTKPTIPAKTDNTLLYTGGGAVVVAALVTVTGFHKKTKGGYSFQNRKKISMSNMAFTITGNKIGIVIRL